MMTTPNNARDPSNIASAKKENNTMDQPSFSCRSEVQQEEEPMGNCVHQIKGHNSKTANYSTNTNT